MKYLPAVVALLLGLSDADRIGLLKSKTCKDACGKYFAGKTMTPDKSVVLSDCNSFMASTVTGTVKTVTATVTLAVFANQTIDESARFTITPLPTGSQVGPTVAPIPDYMHDFGCQSAATALGIDHYTSLCKCAGAKVTKTKVPPSTVTVTVNVPTQVSSFSIRVIFENGTYTYLDLRPYNVAGGEWVGAVEPVSANTTSSKNKFSLTNGTLLHKDMNLMEYERVIPSLDDGTPQLIWFVQPKEERKQNSRPFELTHKLSNGEMVHPLVPQEGGAGIDYSEFFICESCGNQLFLSTSAWKESYIRRTATDKWDKYDWVELHAEPIF